MKKIVFALQLFGIIALLPVCVVLEMNHGTSSVSAIETKIAVADIIENVSTDYSSSIAAYPFAVLALKQLDAKTKKKSGTTCCSCKNCKCGNCKCTDL